MEKSVDLSGLAPRNSTEQEETSTLVETESNPIEWTDEKHSLFLNSMESTFVNQLYESLDKLGWHSSHNNNEPSESKSFKPKLSNVRARSGKFKADRDDGPRTNVNFRIDDEPELDEEEDARVPLAKPPIKQYRSQERRAIRKSSEYPAHNLTCRQDSLDDNTEASGQNFNDEDLEEKKSSRIHKKKNKNLIC